jgi:hypothetical protein
MVQQADAARRRGDWAEAVRLYKIEIAKSPHGADLQTIRLRRASALNSSISCRSGDEGSGEIQFR